MLESKCSIKVSFKYFSTLARLYNYIILYNIGRFRYRYIPPMTNITETLFVSTWLWLMTAASQCFNIKMYVEADLRDNIDQNVYIGTFTTRHSNASITFRIYIIHSVGKWYIFIHNNIMFPEYRITIPEL